MLGGQLFLGFASAEMMPPKQRGDRGDTDSETAGDEFFTQGTKRKIGPTHAGPHWIACRVIANDLEKGGVQAWENACQRLPTTPFFRDLPGGKSET